MAGLNSIHRLMKVIVCIKISISTIKIVQLNRTSLSLKNTNKKSTAKKRTKKNSQGLTCRKLFPSNLAKIKFILQIKISSISSKFKKICVITKWFNWNSKELMKMSSIPIVVLMEYSLLILIFINLSNTWTINNNWV